MKPFSNLTLISQRLLDLGNPLKPFSSQPVGFFWRQVPFPSPLTQLWKSVTSQQGPDSFILIGGWTNLNRIGGDVYLFDENGFSILRENVLQVLRYDHVAMPISTEDFICA